MKNKKKYLPLVLLIPVGILIFILSSRPKPLSELLPLPHSEYHITAEYWPAQGGHLTVEWEAGSPEAEQAILWLNESSYHINPLRAVLPRRTGGVMDYDYGADESVSLRLSDGSDFAAYVRLCAGEVAFRPHEGRESDWHLPSHRGLRTDLITLITGD